MVASELLEATRAVLGGFVTPDRTMLVASSARVFTIDEKSAMGDGRLDPERMTELARRFSRRAILADFAAVAAEAKAPLNAVLLGARRGVGRAADPGGSLPHRDPRGGQGGGGQPARLRGGDVGVDREHAPSPRSPAEQEGLTPLHAPARNEWDWPHTTPLPSFRPRRTPCLPKASARLTDYQDAAYASAIWRASPILPAGLAPTASSSASLPAIWPLRMSVEDVIRVAQLKLRAARLERVAREAKARDGDIVDVTEYLKPGPEEIFGLLPPRLGRWALARVRARSRLAAQGDAPRGSRASCASRRWRH